MIQALGWDSDFWGFPVGMLTLGGPGAPGADPRAAELDEYVVVQSCIDLTVVGPAKRLALLGFFPVATRVELERELPPAPAPGDAGSSSLSDAEWTDTLDAIDSARFAQQFVELSRFRAYPVPVGSIAGFYRTWIENAQAGTFDDGLIHLVVGGASAGLCTYRFREGRLAIGLLAVSPEFRRQGVLDRLIARLDGLARERGVASLMLATEGANIRARRGYARNGFKPVSDTLWLYRVR